MKTKADLVDYVICAMRDRPEDFSCDRHTLDDSKSGLSFWVLNGVFAAGVYQPYNQKFGPIQSLRFHRALKQWKIWKAQTLLQNAQRAA